MKTFIQPYSLERGEIGKPIGKPIVESFPSAGHALAALDRAIRKNSHGPGYYSIILDSGAHASFDAAYTLTFGVTPVYRENRTNLYPKLAKYR